MRRYLLATSLHVLRVIHMCVEWTSLAVHVAKTTLGMRAVAPRSTDIYICTYPKSGTTLTQMLVYQLATDGSMDIPHIDAVAPFFEENAGESPRSLAALPAPRIFKTHVHVDALPSKGRIIYVARNPHDVCLSFYHHVLSVDNRLVPFDSFCESFVRGAPPGMSWSWFSHVKSGLQHRNDPRVLFLTFEEIVADMPEAIRRIAGFLCIELTNEKLESVCQRCSFQFMREHSEKFDPRLGGAWRRPRKKLTREGLVSSERAPE